MNAQIQSQFDRLETALATLIDSITSYNPSPAAAESLVEASDELDQGLRQLAEHQLNYKRIAALQAESDALDQRIKSTLQTLADTRQELLTSTPVTVSNENVRRVDYNELLNYAQRIAKFTVPPTYRNPMPPPIETSKNPVDSNDDDDDNNNDSNDQEVGAPVGLDDDQPAEDSRPSHLNVDGGKAFAALSDATKAWLDPDSDALPFTPWPSEMVIRRGALSQIQAVRERGQDPSEMNLAEQSHNLDTVAELVTQEDEQQHTGRAHRGEIGVSASMPSRADAREAARNKLFEEFELFNPDEG